MDTPVVVAIVSLVFAVVSAAAALGAFAASRGNASRLQQLATADEAAQRVAEAAATSIKGLEDRLQDIEVRLRAESERGDDQERRLRQAEQDVRAIGDAPVPPLPSGRGLAQLEDLRATLRAQAAEAAAADVRAERRA
jgi:hypothetical protein